MTGKHIFKTTVTYKCLLIVSRIQCSMFLSFLLDFLQSLQGCGFWLVTSVNLKVVKLKNSLVISALQLIRSTLKFFVTYLETFVLYEDCSKFFIWLVRYFHTILLCITVCFILVHSIFVLNFKSTTGKPKRRVIVLAVYIVFMNYWIDFNERGVNGFMIIVMATWVFWNSSKVFTYAGYIILNLFFF